MKITDLLKPEGIKLNASPNSKESAINELVDLMYASGNVNDKEEYKRKVLERESESTTGIGEGIAIPHAKTNAVKRAGLAAMVVPNGVDFESLDDEKAVLLFLIGSPDTADNVHLDVLSRLSAMLMDDNFRNRLINAKTKEEFLSIIDETEKEKNNNDTKSTSKGYRVLAVTACPTGIAHTFMAAENLETKAKKMGISIKVETNGSGGIKNRLTSEEIENAECIIVAADKNVEMARFNGKKVIQVRVADGINKAEELLNKAVSGNVPIYQNKASENIVSDETSESIGRQIYKHLMNGVSHMLPFVIGGGILIALAFLFDDYSIDPSNFGKNTPVAEFFKTIGEAAFSFMLPVLAGYIASSIADRPALAVGFVGGAIANAGGSGFLGALAAGFIAGYLIVGLRKLFNYLPKSFEGTKPVLLYPLFGILFIGLIITFIINPPVSAFNTWLSSALNSMGDTSRVLLGLILGGMMSIDFGGPINKAAYVFGTASIADGNYEIMAPVMIGGMVPPLAIALCTIFFKKKFTKKERQSGLTNIIMGLSFITEGAIPFAASDPLRVIPACAVGSAVAGGLSMFFNCTLMAPHGGIFVFPVVGNPLKYLISLIIGSVVSMFILGLIKKEVTEE